MNEALHEIRTPHPTQCALWTAEPPARDMLYDLLDRVEVYEDDDHLRHSLLRCRECGQLHFKEFYEVPDYADGNDGIYQTWIPVADAESARLLARQSIYDILKYPAIRTDSPRGTETSSGPRWNVRRN